MITYIRKFLGLCVHKWKIIDKFIVRCPSSGLATGTEYILQCENCGNIKRKKYFS